MRRLGLLSVVVVALSCGDSTRSSSGGPAPITSPEDPKERARAAASIAQEILENPDQGQEVLRKHEMTPDEFSDLMYEIAGDPELAEVYDTVRG